MLKLSSHFSGQVWRWLFSSYSTRILRANIQTVSGFEFEVSSGCSSRFALRQKPIDSDVILSDHAFRERDERPYCANRGFVQSTAVNPKLKLETENLKLL